MDLVAAKQPYECIN